MPQRTSARLASLIVLVTLLLSIPQVALAQSTVDLVVHYVEGSPAEEEIAYNVSVYLSVVDSAGNPVKDLGADALTVTEDSQKVDVASLHLANDEPINVVLVMDTSGSMGGTGINAAKTAASNFVAGLGPDDMVAVVTFDNTVQTRIDFTKDHRAARDQIALVDAVRGAGTCLYDAAYQAIQMSSTLPSGRRAVILFTDGVDETASGGVCSSHTADDVIDLASAGGTRTPVYTLGMGSRIDANGLKRLAELTGGRSLYSPDATQLDTVFVRLSDQLRSQYELTYTSVGGPGPHTLAVSVNYLSAQDSDTRNFLLPAMPTRISFVSPTAGQDVSGVTHLAVSLTGQGETVDRVAFEINGEVVGTDDTVSYEVEVDLNSYSAGNLNISAIAYGVNNVELTRKSIDVNLVGTVEVPATPTPKTRPVNTAIIVGVGAIGLVFVTAVIIAFVLISRRKREKERDEAWAKAQSYEVSAVAPPSDERTYDGWEPGPDSLGMLVVTASDDSTMVGHRFEITKSTTTLGRSADNDVNFPKDSPVSRHHAQIVEKNGGLYLNEVQSVDSSGQAKPPTYGTFLNETPLGQDPEQLQSGDEIRLGKRVRLKFEAAGRIADTNAVTYDGLITSEDDDRTREQ